MAKKRVDNVRASRDGHEYHEIWAALKSLELLNPNSNLRAIAIEGPSPDDQNSAQSDEIEIADIVLYYKGNSFNTSDKVSIIQVKYSVASKDIPVEASYTKKTIEKFSKTYKDYIQRFSEHAHKKLEFQFITNRPIPDVLKKAVENIAVGVENFGEYLKIEKQFKAATHLRGSQLKKFASICKFSSYTKLLSTSNIALENTLILLSATSNSIACSRLGKIKELVRAKAGTAGSPNNLIEQTDVLAALNLQDIHSLFPCPEALSDWGDTLVREQSNDAIRTISSTNKTTLIHATGGVGKTVFMKSIADKLSKNHEVVFFDSFGGGSYRSQEGARHLAKHGLIHIANILASRGLCGLILPNTPDDQTLAKTFRFRLQQCRDTLRKCEPQRKIFIFIDAIDNAQFAAEQNREPAFPKLLLENFHDNPIDGVKVIVSCRTERIPKTYAKYDALELKPFSKNETTTFLKQRMNDVTSLFIDNAYSRSGGNARVLEHLIESNGQIHSRENSRILLDDLLTQKIESAIDIALQKGSSKEDLTRFLSGLTLLAPPVSIHDYALINDVSKNAITSMISDLAPLIELSKYGVMFKDEPTETLIIKKYGSEIKDLEEIASNLYNAQNKSVFAAKALPNLLYRLEDSERIYSLVNNGHMPSSITSDVSKLRIRYARLKVAAKCAAKRRDYDKLIGFLVKISITVESDQRGVNYLLNHPKLVAELNDSDTIRRVYEAQTTWPGTRDARLAIIHILCGDIEEAHGYVDSLSKWISHALRVKSNFDFVCNSDIKAIDCTVKPLFLLAKKSPKDAAKCFSISDDYFSFKIAAQLYQHTPFAIDKDVISKSDISTFQRELNNVGAIVATLHFCNISRADKSLLLKKLAAILKKENVKFSDRLSSDQNFILQKCFLYASLKSLNENKKTNAKTILNALKSDRPRIDAFTDHHGYCHRHSVGFLLQEVIRSIISNKEITYFDILPIELYSFGKSIRNKKDQKDFLKRLKIKIKNFLKFEGDESNRVIQKNDQLKIENFLNNRLPQLYLLAVAVKNLLSSSEKKSKEKFNDLIDVWKNFSKNTSHKKQIPHLWVQFGYEVIIFSLFTVKNIKATDLNKILNSKIIDSINIGSKMSLIQAISVLLPDDELTEKVAHKISREILLQNHAPTRANYFFEIAEYLHMVNKDEAIEYFKKGLSAVNAIGSRDYHYVNQLLIFTASLHGKELDSSDFYPLNNICELNMNEKTYDVYWKYYGAAFSKIAGLRGFAQLSRWDDRQRVSLSYTLFPYLIALVKDNKISPNDALALNYLASPIKHHRRKTSNFYKYLHLESLTEAELKELIRQFFLNTPDSFMSSTIKDLAKISEIVLGNTAQETIQLKKSHAAYKILIDERNPRRNMPRPMNFRKRQGTEDEKKRALFKQIDEANPSDKESFRLLITSLSKQNNTYELKDQFFTKVREKIHYNKRKYYIENLASLEDENFSLSWALNELSKCYTTWGVESISLKKAFKNAGMTILHQNSMHSVGHDYFLKSYINQISDFSGMSVSDLTLELIKLGTQHNVIQSGTGWLSLATLLNEKSSENIGQQALTSLLNSHTASLGERASDSQYKPELYPNDTNQIIANLIWKVLGSYDAKERWRAAHSIRCFAKFNRWDVISEIVSLISTKNAGVFQSPKIKFYDYHARLWLLITLARLAKDYPKNISKYKEQIFPFTKENHVLFRHFAAKALLDCHSINNSLLSDNEVNRLQKVNTSPRLLVEKSTRRADSYVDRPNGTPQASHQFYFEYEFRKRNVDWLGDVFNIDCWKMDDLIAKSAHEIAPEITDYRDHGNKLFYRRPNYSNRNKESYGEQVAWHALHITAGKLLATHSVTKNSWTENSWNSWLSNYLLTREDGFWQSDTLDMIPLETEKILLEKKRGKLVLPEDKNVLLDRINIKNKIGKDIIIDGDWESKDGVNVNISSALVQKKYSKMAITALSEEGPSQVCLPKLSEGHGFQNQDRHNLLPWIVSMGAEKTLDEFDPYNTNTTSLRSKISKVITESFELNSTEQFKRFWTDKNGKRILKSELWKGVTSNSYAKEYSGNRLTCSSNFLKKLLKKNDNNLIILIILNQYIEPDSKSDFPKLLYSIGIVEINEKLEIKYRKGCNNDN